MLIDCLLWVRLLVSSRLLVVKFWGNQKLYMEFQLLGIGTPTPALFSVQLYMHLTTIFTTSHKPYPSLTDPL